MPFSVVVTLTGRYWVTLAERRSTQTLLTATADLDDEDVEELTLYALFRRARQRKKGKR